MTLDTTTATTLRAHGLSLGYPQRLVIDELDLEIGAGCTAVVGPNGCGKSTLLAGMVRLLTPREGQIHLADQSVTEIPARRLAQLIALLAQSPNTPDGVDVRTLVRYGRFPYRRPLRGWTPADQVAVEDAMRRCRVDELADRPVSSLSGGQAQRVWLACAVAQETPWLLADEPTSYLDLGHQTEVLRLLRSLADEGRSVVMVLHDLNHAIQYADRIVVLDDGQVRAEGRPHDVVTPEMLRATYGVEAWVMSHPDNGRPLVVPAV